MVAAGRVRVDGRVALPGERADPGRERILVDGRPLPARPPTRALALHKPFGVVSTLRDPDGRPTVADLLPAGQAIVPIGRLDLASEGLLVCTNDGDLVQTVGHPSSGVVKVYRAWVAGGAVDAACRALARGVVLEDGPARPERVRRLTPAEAGRGLVLDDRPRARAATAVVEVALVEGRNREVRRMAEAVGLDVLRLVRVAVGPVTLTGLRPGRYRYLSEQEVAALARPADGRAQPRPGRASGSGGRAARSGGHRAET